MNKKTKIILGVGIVAAIGYFVWKNNQSKDIFANASGISICEPSSKDPKLDKPPYCSQITTKKPTTPKYDSPVH
jgi:hypothetical protein